MVDFFKLDAFFVGWGVWGMFFGTFKLKFALGNKNNNRPVDFRFGKSTGLSLFVYIGKHRMIFLTEYRESVNVTARLPSSLNVDHNAGPGHVR
ncbi:hypothetical protein [Secundilactobacillus muriivasis]